MTCRPPLGGPCGFPATEAARVRATFLPPTEDAFPLCPLHQRLMREVGMETEYLTGHERAVALEEVSPMVVGGVPIGDCAPGELVELFGR